MPGNVRGPVPTALVGRNRWCRLPRKCAAAAALCLHAHRDCGNASAAAAALCLHAHRASGNARQLFYGIPKATCQVTSR